MNAPTSSLTDSASVKSASPKVRLAEFDCLRGLAILLIVMGHSIFLSQQGFPMLLENLLRGGTGLFVFISGFFFHRLFYPQFSYCHFLTKKVKSVFVPFVVISLIALSFRCIGWYGDDNELHIILLNCWYTIRNGFVLYPHWYIPFIMLTFICAPLHVAYIKTSPVAQLLLLVFFIAVALVIHRPEFNINPLQSLVYFSAFYLLGILFSLYESALNSWNTLLLWLAGLTALSTALLQTYVVHRVGNYHKPAFEWGGIDWQCMQVLCASIFLLLLFRRLAPGRVYRHLTMLADYSFPIFFVHPLFTMAIDNLLHRAIVAGWVISPGFWPAIGLTAVVFIIQLYGSLLAVKVVRKYLGKRSKLIVG